MSEVSDRPNPEIAAPPKLALRLLEAVLMEEDRDSLIGDLLEEYDALARRHSLARARRWLWEQALGSMGPMLWKRAVKALSGAMLGKPALRLQTVTQGPGLFERSLLDGPGGQPRGRRWWLVPAAIGIHFSVFLGLAAARMWSLEELSEPVVEAAYIPVMLPEPPAAPRPKGEQGGQRVKPPGTVPVDKPEVIRPPVPVTIPVAPIEVPELKLQDLPMMEFAIDEPAGDPTGDPAGVSEGQTGGVPWGVPGGQGGDQPIQVRGDVRAPEVIRRVEPRYPPLAIRARIQGEVLVEATIDKQGNVVGARVIQSLGGGLNEESIRAVQAWKFKPATLNGRPVAVYFIVSIKFQLT